MQIGSAEYPQFLRLSLRNSEPCKPTLKGNFPWPISIALNSAEVSWMEGSCSVSRLSRSCRFVSQIVIFYLNAVTWYQKINRRTQLKRRQTYKHQKSRWRYLITSAWCREIQRGKIGLSEDNYLGWSCKMSIFGSKRFENGKPMNCHETPTKKLISSGEQPSFLRNIQLPSLRRKGICPTTAIVAKIQPRAAEWREIGLHSNWKIPDLSHWLWFCTWPSSSEERKQSSTWFEPVVATASVSSPSKTSSKMHARRECRQVEPLMRKLVSWSGTRRRFVRRRINQQYYCTQGCTGEDRSRCKS